MTSVEKRRSGRRSGGHRKHSDGGFSDTSSAGSFLDETDREVSNLTDRAFRSLCIGDEAVYNDSDLGASSPCTQRDRQLAFGQSAQEREREELKRAAHESFSLRMQQYGQEWIHRGMYGAEIQRDPQWEGYEERTQGRVSATFQHSFVETAQQEESLTGEQLSLLSNGATEVSSQQRRSRSRVSSLIRAFNSDGQRDGAVTDGKQRDWNDETSWDKSALMSIQRELSEFSTSYQENLNSGHYPSAGQYSAQNTDFYSSEVAAMTQVNPGSAFMRSSHSMSAQVNCNSNFFIHSEFSPFKVWRDHNRFPFQQGEVSGFMHYPDFPKWYETPMYRELSLEAQSQIPYRFEEREMRYMRNNLAPVVPPTPPRAISTSTMLQRAPAVEKRCDSELTGHYPYRKRAQSLGANKLQAQRPSTASPTVEMSRRVQDTISSVRALQQKIKMMTEQNIITAMPTTHQGVSYNNENLNSYGNYAQTATPNVVSSNTSTTPFNISQLLTPAVHISQETDTLDIRQHAVSPQLVEHAPVRAESRGATPDVRMSSYKSRATSLLFNLKDNRKRVKSTYSPTKFKGLETQEKNKQPLIQEPRDTVIDMPDFTDADAQYSQVEGSNWMNAASHHYVNQYQSLGSTNYEPATAHAGPYSEYTSSNYQTAQMQGEMVHHSGFTGFIPENYTSNQLANGQNLYEDLSSFTPYKQGMMDNVVTQGGDGYRHNLPYTAAEPPRVNADNHQIREYLINNANTVQHFNETTGRVDGYQQLNDNNYGYGNVSLQDVWRQTNSQDMNAAIPPWAQEKMASVGYEQAYQSAAMTNEEVHLPRDKHGHVNPQVFHNEQEKNRLGEGFKTSHALDGFAPAYDSNQLTQYGGLSDTTKENQAYYGYQQPGTVGENYGLQKESGHISESTIKDENIAKTINRLDEEEHNHHPNKDFLTLTQEPGQKNQPILNGYEMQNSQQVEFKPQFQHNMENNAYPDDVSDLTLDNKAKDRKFDEVKPEQAMALHVKAQHAQAELAFAQHWAKEQQPKEESAELNLAGQTGPEKVKEEEKEGVHQARADEEKRKDGIIETLTEEQQREVETKEEQRLIQKVTQPSYITEEAGAEHMKEEQDEQVKVEQAEAQTLKEEPIKTELAEPGQAGIQPSKRAESEAEQLEEEKLRAEQVKRERTEAERIRIEKSKAEYAEEQRQKEEQEKQQQIKEQAKAEERAKDMDKDLIQATYEEHINPEPQIREAKVEKLQEKETELVNSKEIEVNATKPKLINTERIQDSLAELAPKLTSSQPVKSEPDKVEQAKTELAKAKAELAKIKEKMKVKNTVSTKDEEVKKDVSVTVCKDKNEDRKHEDQATKPEHQQSKDLDVNSIQELDEYKRLREKYGFIDTPIATTTITAAASSHGANETPVFTLDKSETNLELSEGKISPPSEFKTSNTENKDEATSLESHEGTESQYIYSESSKEFKLSSGGNIFTGVGTIKDPVTDKVKEEKAEKLEEHDQPIQPDVSKRRDTNLVIQPPVERKSRSTEHGVGPSKDPHLNPHKALSHKERAQTKQEILTSKIKAHAEKEISAIKEKGFAKRDGLSSKTLTKQLGGAQIINARQKPPSQEAPKKYDSTTPSNKTPKHQTEPQGIQMTPVKPVSSSSSAAMPGKSGATSHQSADQTQNVPKEPINENVTKLIKEDRLTGIQPLKTENNLVDSKNKEPSTQSKEQPIKNQRIKQESSHCENSGNKANELKDKQVLDSVSLIKENKPKPVAEVKESQPSANEKPESKNEALLEDSVPTLSLVLGGNHTSAVDDSLQIRGIMVTVRERKPSLSSDEISHITPDQTHVTVKESSNSDPQECPKSSAPEETKGDKLSEEFTKVDTAARDVQGTNPTMAKVWQTIHPENENIQGASVLETSQNNLFNNVTEKSPDVKQEIQAGDAKPRRETQLHEPLAEKGSPSTVTVPAKNKALAETQTLPYNQDIIPRETKDLTNETQMKSIKTDEVQTETQENISYKRPTEHTNENFTSKVVNNVFHEADIEALTKPNIQPSVKDDTKTNINHTSGSYADSTSVPLLEKEKHQSTPVNKTGPSRNSADKRVPPEENVQLGDDIHIDSIAIRVVPAVIEDYTGKAETHHSKPNPSDVIASTDQIQDISSKDKGQLMNDNITKDLVALSGQSSLEDNVSVQNVLSSVKNLSDSLKNNSQKENIHAAPQNIKAETGQAGVEITSGNAVNKPKVPPTEEDYFQVQGIALTDPSVDRNARGSTSERKEPPGLQSNKAVSGQKSNSEVGKEAFVLDQSLRKIAEMNSASFQEEEVKKNNKETEENLASKHHNGPTERQSTTNEKSEASQAAHVRKHHTENRRERQRNSNPARENPAAEKPEAKPTPKPRASTIPEISALADYARLKVIVSEDRENPIQEFPPNKKEGFFPLIQSRHSRRPVFNADPQDFTVKEKAVPNKTEASSKVNKEPKPLVFPITDKEHQRTGMFKLGEKEKQDKLHLNVKAKEETRVKHAQNIQERIKSPTVPSQKKGIGEEAPPVDVKRPYEVQDSVYHSSNPPLKATNSSSASNRPISTSQQIKPNVSINPNEKPGEFSSAADRVPHLDKYFYSQGHNTEESMRTSRKLQETGNVQEMLEKDVSGKVQQERNATQHEDIKIQQLEEEHSSTEDKKMKHIASGSRASLAEEQRKAAQREEERRAKEREAIANQIKERREKQKEYDKKEEEERKREEAEKDRVAKKEERIRAKQRQIEDKRVKEIREKWLMKDEEEKRRQIEAEERRAAREEQQRRAAEEEQTRRVAQEEQRRAALEEQRRKAAQEEQQRRASEEDQLRRAAKEERQRRAVQEEQRRKAAEEEQQRRVAEEEQRRKAAEEEQQRRAAEEEQQRRAALEEQQRRAAEEEQRRKAAEEEQQRRAALEEQQRRAAEEEQRRKAAQEEQQRRAAQEEQKRRAAEEELQRRRAAQEEQQRRAAQEEQRRKAAQEEQQRRAALEEQQRRAAEEEQQRRAAEEEQRRKAALEEQERRRAAEEEHQRRAALEEEERRRAAEEEKQRRAKEEEQQRRKAVQEEHKRRASEEEQHRRAAQEEQRKKAALQEEERLRAAEEKQQRRKAAEEEQQRRQEQEEQRKAALEEQRRRTVQEQKDKRRAAEEEQQRRAAMEEQRRKAAETEQERRSAHEELQRRAAKEEQMRAVLEEKKRKEAQEEHQRKKAAEEERRRRAAEEQHRRAQEEQERRTAQEEQHRRALQKEQERRDSLEEKQRRAALKEQQARAVQEERQRRAVEEELERRAAMEEQQRRAAEEEQQWRAALIEEKRQAKRIEEKILSDIEERKKLKQREKDRAAQISDHERIRQSQEVRKHEHHIDERDGRHRNEGRSKVFEENQAALREENKRMAQAEILVQQEDGERDKTSERSEALQYYAITSTDSESKPRERQVFSPSPPQQRLNPSGLESSEDSGSHSRSYRPHAAASPAPSLSRSNTSSPAMGIKPSMFRVKDNTFRSSSFTKSVKPRFHKNFGEDFRVGSPMERGPERVEEEQETVRRSAGTPVHPDRQSSAHQPSSASQDYSAALPHRPFSRRSFALDEDDSRSVISNMSEGVESFATSVADLSELRSFYYDERPESACSFSSDVSRSMGRPPAVPPKSEKAMRRAKRLTSRRINKELSKAGADSSADVEKPHQDVSSVSTLSSSTEVRSTNRHVVASPHFAPPVSIAHAPTVESSLPSSRTEHQSSHSSFHATPHATAPISLPVATPHATAPVSLPVVSTHATGPAPNSAAPKTVAHIPSSPSPRRANPPASVTQYHVESGYPPSYPLTQRKVLQDLGSGQYFVVDVPVPVKTKTFIDPETGKYVQLNVRESAHSAPRPQPKPQPQPAYNQPQVQPQTQVKPQQPNTQAPPAGKPAVLYEGYHGYPQGYQPAANKSALHHRSSAPVTSHQEQQPVREGRVYGYPAPENRQNSEGPRYSPEKTPYMDTVNDSGRTYNRVYNTHGPYESFPECDTNSQLAGSPVCENDNSAHSGYQPREIITISELEDFMEVSDW